MVNNKFIYFWGFFSLACLLATSAHAGVQISYAEADVDENTVLIMGKHFGSRPAVFTDGTALDVLESSGGFVKARLWESPEPGTYKLFVKNKDRKNKSHKSSSSDKHTGTSDHIDVTLSAAVAALPEVAPPQECTCDIDREEFETLQERMEQLEALPAGTEELEALLARVDELETLLGLPGDVEALQARVEALENAAGAEEETPCIDSSTCAAGQYCEKPFGSCIGEGTCRSRPDSCSADWAPACGCDGITYDNACEAAAAGTGVRMAGECLPF